MAFIQKIPSSRTRQQRAASPPPPTESERIHHSSSKVKGKSTARSRASQTQTQTQLQLQWQLQQRSQSYNDCADDEDEDNCDCHEPERNDGQDRPDADERLRAETLRSPLLHAAPLPHQPSAPAAKSGTTEPTLFVDTSAAQGYLSRGSPSKVSSTRNNRRAGGGDAALLESMDRLGAHGSVANPVKGNEKGKDDDWSVVFPGRAALKAQAATAAASAAVAVAEAEAKAREKQSETQAEDVDVFSNFEHDREEEKREDVASRSNLPPPAHDGRGMFSSAGSSYFFDFPQQADVIEEEVVVALSNHDEDDEEEEEDWPLESPSLPFSSDSSASRQRRHSGGLRATGSAAQAHTSYLGRATSADSYSTTSVIFSPFEHEHELGYGYESWSDAAAPATAPPDAVALEERERAIRLLRNVDVFYKEHHPPVTKGAAAATAAASCNQHSQSQPQWQCGPSSKQQVRHARQTPSFQEQHEFEHLLALAPSALSAGLSSTSYFAAISAAGEGAGVPLLTVGAGELFASTAPAHTRGTKRSRRCRRARQQHQRSILGMLDGDYSGAGHIANDAEEDEGQDDVVNDEDDDSDGLTDEASEDTAAAAADRHTCRSSKRSNNTSCSRSVSTVHTHQSATTSAGGGGVTLAMVRQQQKLHAKSQVKAKAKAKAKGGSNMATVHVHGVFGRRSAGAREQAHTATGKGAELRQAEQQLTAGQQQRPPLSRGERVMSAILRRVFDLEPEVLDGFFECTDSADADAPHSPAPADSAAAAPAPAAAARSPLRFGFGYDISEAPLDYMYAHAPTSVSAVASCQPHWPRSHHYHLHAHTHAMHCLAQIDELLELQQDSAAVEEKVRDREAHAVADAEADMTDIKIWSSDPATASEGALALHRYESPSSQLHAYSGIFTSADARRTSTVGTSIDTSPGRGNSSKAEALEGLPQHLEPTTIEALNALMGGVPFRIWTELAKHFGLPTPGSFISASDDPRAPMDGRRTSSADADRVSASAIEAVYSVTENAAARGEVNRSRSASSASSLSLRLGSATRSNALAIASAGAGLPARDDRDILPKAWRGRVHPAIAAQHSPKE
ncbi:hypothetical protein K437DRAFT_139663 [Tilletiaria anomala UBC 951]|uniref:Uncharacterized protein n=1 Tax=Tilletiaria anomala (strain ATCC 24038 / CBS 436.72 / UBC 951) TaxID=1037660 RepID=A0A066VRY6_TILAU|nr:uncharacterized protein K437DRAFT_139663 [Tilletiaria anomala UBC 951]KDN44241.1 hypothetical protein K437DRAFT_139663 [Tilletiaria anomala UBC 951]